MQIGFAFLEAGNIQVKHVTNILMKVVMNSLLAAFGWWACGFAFAYGERENVGEPFDRLFIPFRIMGL